ncbi:uncharacterized protein ASPGLDRAFT_36831 [Aspergillus glaucus CBS 516.65]|uniref:DUF7881 domain-containing protein n=1 Tax=Aspergillus glaucus CBS 516.65 TaxID=1160497 RepID=A0A1L9VFM3_ASPGL|nr:hypothetical protein ASPGLDRAFT_36831 [Aspergillus glaucus CBS 516.65]OJJ82709.1 hypothetical protein ASPGLDRAFT_36831 [Aspergillus glaucus CBS 516.65]
MDNRVGFRNVHIYNGITGEMLGGLRQNGSITEAVFLSMLNDILLIADEPLEVKERDSQRTILPSSNPLEFGSMEMNKEPCFLLYPHKAKKVNAVAARTRSEVSSFNILILPMYSTTPTTNIPTRENVRRATPETHVLDPRDPRTNLPANRHAHTTDFRATCMPPVEYHN